MELQVVRRGLEVVDTKLLVVCRVCLLLHMVHPMKPRAFSPKWEICWGWFPPMKPYCLVFLTPVVRNYPTMTIIVPGFHCKHIIQFSSDLFLFQICFLTSANKTCHQEQSIPHNTPQGKKLWHNLHKTVISTGTLDDSSATPLSKCTVQLMRWPSSSGVGTILSSAVDVKVPLVCSIDDDSTVTTCSSTPSPAIVHINSSWYLFSFP